MQVRNNWKIKGRWHTDVNCPARKPLSSMLQGKTDCHTYVTINNNLWQIKDDTIQVFHCLFFCTPRHLRTLQLKANFLQYLDVKLRDERFIKFKHIAFSCLFIHHGKNNSVVPLTTRQVLWQAIGVKCSNIDQLSLPFYDGSFSAFSSLCRKN